jgi:hypothetical protein
LYRAERETDGKARRRRGRSADLVDEREKVEEDFFGIVCGFFVWRERGSKVLAYRYNFLLCFSGRGK